MHAVFIILCAVFLVTSCSHHKEDVQELVESNPQGIVLRTKKAFTVETPNAGAISFYTVIATNVPPGQKFFMQMCDYMSDDISPLELISDDGGRLWVLGDKKIPLDKYPMNMGGFLPGDFCPIWLVKQNKSIAVKTTVIPYPLQAFGNDGAEISIARVVANGSLVSCKGSYFQDGEEIQIFSSSKSKTVSKTIVCKNGTFRTTLEPPETKCYGELVTVEILRKNGELLTLSYPWGRESFNKDYLMANPMKFKEEDYKKIYEAMEEFYLPHASPRGLA